ncbi:MAG: SCO family protein [Proteobacteria bacterium]|uniref:SCO family protein n=1 Tax=Aquabacterium sp. TaxID=1872578 RepID=UPI0035C72003|nr:SCO family protein [Pseudomonadota bacterium]
MSTPDTGRRSLLRAAGGFTATAFAIASLASLSACDKHVPGGPPIPKLKFNAVDITGADYARQLALKDFDGKQRTLADFKGKVVFVFFGFTQCPDVCPTTMAELAEVRRRLGADGSKVQGVFVSVDPERDTPEVLKAYLGNLDASFVGLTGSLDQVDATAREFKVFYQKVPTPGGSYTLDHTAGAYVFDPAGRVRLFVRYGLGVDALTSDLRQLLAS